LFICKNQNEDKEFKDELKFQCRRREIYEQKKEQIRKYVSPTRNDILQQQLKLKMEMEDQFIQKNIENSKALKDKSNKTYCEGYCGLYNLDATTIQIKEKKEYLKQLMEENKEARDSPIISYLLR
jgi:uncharacterized protein VirK/YbjX